MHQGQIIERITNCPLRSQLACHREALLIVVPRSGGISLIPRDVTKPQQRLGNSITIL